VKRRRPGESVGRVDRKERTGTAGRGVGQKQRKKRGRMEGLGMGGWEGEGGDRSTRREGGRGEERLCERRKGGREEEERGKDNTAGGGEGEEWRAMWRGGGKRERKGGLKEGDKGERMDKYENSVVEVKGIEERCRRKGEERREKEE